MIKILHKAEAEILSELPLEVVTKVVEIAIILDDNYGKDRDGYYNLGGYILIAKDKKDVDVIQKLIDFQYILPEYIEQIKCCNGDNYTSSLILLSSDYSISLIIPVGLTPKER